jgi:putative membrane protein
LCLAASALAPVWAASLGTAGAAQPLPDGRNPSTGSGSVIPVMLADTQAHELTMLDTPATGGAPPAGKPIDDIQFVKQATESGRHEINAAQEALPQLHNPELKQIAEMLVSDHGSANERLARIAAAKGWPVPAPGTPAAPPAGTASSDFDAKWTSEMIAGHERSVALYRAQAQSGEDEDVRKYARETLPTIERHLAQLRKLQK